MRTILGSGTRLAIIHIISISIIIISTIVITLVMHSIVTMNIDIIDDHHHRNMSWVDGRLHFCSRVCKCKILAESIP